MVLEIRIRNFRPARKPVRQLVSRESAHSQFIRSLILIFLIATCRLHARCAMLPDMTGETSAGQFPFPVALEGVYVRDIYGNADTLEVLPLKEVRIPHKKNSLDFRLSYPDLPEHRVSLKYRLNNIVTNWTDAPHNSNLRLDRLPTGSYTLRVKAVNHLDHEGPELSYAFRIMPPFYASRMAVVCYMLLGEGIFLAMWANERRKFGKRHISHAQAVERQLLIRQNEELRNEMKEREAELFQVTDKMITRSKTLHRIKNEFDSYRKSVPEQRFPVSLYERVNTLIESHDVSENEWKLFAVHFEQNYKEFFNSVKERHPNLTAGDLKLCACLKLNLSTKDIASLLSISVRGVEIGRYRLRKKIGVDSSVNLNDYFIDNF